MITHAATLIALVGLAGAETPTTRAGLRYIDYQHGFSLRPPVGAERRRAPSATRLVSWRMHDAETGAVLWTLSVHRAVEAREVEDLSAYAKVLVERLKRGEGFRVDQAGVVDHGDARAVELRGVSRGRARFYQRQRWVPAGKRRFILLKLTGPAGRRDALDAVFEAVAPTLDVVDPATAARRREKRLDRGRELLGELDAERVVAAVHDEPRWFLMRKDDEPVGFLRVVERVATRRGARGIEVRTWAYVQPTDAPSRRVRRVLFAAVDRSVEAWTERAWVRQADGEDRLAYEIHVVTADDAITCRITRHHRGEAQAKRFARKIPPPNRGLYLPQAFTELLPRLVKRDAPQAWSFATYNAQANGFDMHTFAVTGPEKIDLGGQTLPAVRCVEQRAADRPGATMWMDEAGLPLRMIDAGGLATVAADKARVREAFGRAERIVAEMGDGE
ncbi:MAG: hypothetical protein ACOC8F_05665 [Planctomycetota bacterium]